MTLSYADYGTLMAKLLAVTPATRLTVDNVELLNAMIDYAELRIYREMDFLTTELTPTVDLIVGSRNIQIPDSIFIVNSAYVITPAGEGFNTGTRHPLQRISRDLINLIWPTTPILGLPQYYTMNNDTLMLVAPTPDDVYKVVILGIMRPLPLYTMTPGTYISTYLPDLFVAASCVWGFGAINQNFGASSDDPATAMSWEQQYQTLKAGVMIETLRQKAWMEGWQPFSQTPVAKQSRT